MRKVLKRVLATVAAICMVASSTPATQVAKAAENTLYVGSTRTYKTISAAISAASGETLIKVDPGKYTEQLNITKNNITIEGEDLQSITIVDMSGRVVMNVPAENSMNVRLDGLKSGVYIIVVESKKGLAKQTLIKR